MKAYIDYIFRNILRCTPERIEMFPRAIRVTLPKGATEILAVLNLTSMLQAYSLPVTGHQMDTDNQQVTFTLVPDKPMETVERDVFTNIVSRWSGQLEQGGSKPTDLQAAFQSFYRLNVEASWELFDDVCDLSVRVAGRDHDLSGFCKEADRKITSYDDRMKDSDVRLLSAVWDIIYEPSTMRINRGYSSATTYLRINSEPGRAETRTTSTEGRLDVLCTYDGLAYKCHHTFDITADLQGLKNLVRRWNADLWTLFF